MLLSSKMKTACILATASLQLQSMVLNIINGETTENERVLAQRQKMIAMAMRARRLKRKKRKRAVRIDEGPKRKKKRSKTWSLFVSGLTKRLFRRMFRMERACFDRLCNDLIAFLDENTFKPSHLLHFLTVE